MATEGIEGAGRRGGTMPHKDTAPERGATDKGKAHARAHSKGTDDANTRARNKDRTRHARAML